VTGVSRTARLTDEIPDFNYSLAGVLGLRAIKSLAEKDRKAVEAARYSALTEVYRHRREGAIATVGPDFELGPVYVDDDARVVVTYRTHGRIAEPQAMPIARFCTWPAAMKETEILGVHLEARNAIAAYGKGRDGTLECSVWDARYAGQVLLRRDVLRDYADLTPEGRRFADALRATPDDEHPWPRPPDGAIVAASAATEVLCAEATEPTTSGDPVGWWCVFRWSPFGYIAGSALPPDVGPSRRAQVRAAALAEVSREVYGRTRPDYPGARDQQVQFSDDVLPSLGRTVSIRAAKEHKARRDRVLGHGTLTLAEHQALSDVELAILNAILWGRVGWQYEVANIDPCAGADPRLPQIHGTSYRGGSQKIWIDVTGDTAVTLGLGLLSLPSAATLWPTVKEASTELMSRLIKAGLTRRQAVVLLDTQAGLTDAEIGEVLRVARSTVRAHLSAGRKVLKRNLSAD
jgi:hypothetical protein